MFQAYFGNAHASLEIQELSILPWETSPHLPTSPSAFNTFLIPQNPGEGMKHWITLYIP